MGAFLFCAQCRGIRTRKGAELRKREAFSSAAREERSDEAEAGGASRTRTSLIAHHRIGNGPRKGTVFVWAQRMGFEPDRVRS